MRSVAVCVASVLLFSLGLSTAGVEGNGSEGGRYLSIPPLEDRTPLSLRTRGGHGDDPPWIPNIKVSDDPDTLSQNETSMGIFGRSLYMAWNDNRMGVYHVGFSYSTNSGDTWAPNQLLTEPTYPEQGDPVVAVDDSGYVYVGVLSFDRYGWESDIYVLRSTDGGQTWGTPVLASANTPTSFEDKEWVTANGESLYVTFASFESGVDINFCRSTDRGQTFLPYVRVNDNPPMPSGRNGSMPVGGPGGEIYVSWGMDERISPEGIYVAKSTDGGASFGANVRVADQYFTWANTPWRMTGIPAMAVSQTNGDVYIVWNDTVDANLEVYFSRSTDGGATFSPRMVVNDNPPGDVSWQFMPWVCVDPFGDIHVVWYDTRSGGLDLDVYYAKSMDRGQSFGPNLRVTDQATMGRSFIGDYIAVVADSGRAYCAWSDSRNGDQDAYFSRYSWVGVEEVAKSQIPNPKSQLLKCCPSPFTYTTIIHYSLAPRRGDAETGRGGDLSAHQPINLSVYDVAGRLVRTLVDGHSEAGTASVTWDGKDVLGTQVAGGVYLCRLRDRGFTSTLKLALVR